MQLKIRINPGRQEVYCDYYNCIIWWDTKFDLWKFYLNHNLYHLFN